MKTVALLMLSLAALVSSAETNIENEGPAFERHPRHGIYAAATPIAQPLTYSAVDLAQPLQHSNAFVNFDRSLINPITAYVNFPSSRALTYRSLDNKAFTPITQTNIRLNYANLGYRDYYRPLTYSTFQNPLIRPLTYSAPLIQKPITYSAPLIQKPITYSVPFIQKPITYSAPLTLKPITYSSPFIQKPTLYSAIEQPALYSSIVKAHPILDQAAPAPTYNIRYESGIPVFKTL